MFSSTAAGGRKSEASSGNGRGLLAVVCGRVVPRPHCGCLLTAFAATGAETSMAEIARRSGVGPATLYRNFATRSLTRHSPDYTGAAPDVHAVRRTVRNPTLRRFAALTESGCAVAIRRSQPPRWRPRSSAGLFRKQEGSSCCRSWVRRLTKTRDSGRVCSRRRPVAELWNVRPSRGSMSEGELPSRSSMSQAIFQHRVAGGRGC